MVGLLEVRMVGGGRAGYDLAGRRRVPRPGESLAGACARLGPTALRLPAAPWWPASVTALVAGVASAPLPRSVEVVEVGEVRLRLADPLQAAAWRFVVAAVTARRQVQSTSSTGLPAGVPPARATAASTAKSSN